MIGGIGIDTVDISRFADWYEKPDAELTRIFSPEEITYCKENNALSAQRFAVRFAAREAFFKAWCTAHPNTYIPFLELCPMITITPNKHKAPILTTTIATDDHFHLSLSHTKIAATAIVVIEKP